MDSCSLPMGNEALFKFFDLISHEFTTKILATGEVLISSEESIHVLQLYVLEGKHNTYKITREQVVELYSHSYNQY